MNTDLFSIRMRAANADGHLCGAEQLVPVEQLPGLIVRMAKRAQNHSRGNPETIRISIDAVPAATVHLAQLPDITTVVVADVASGRAAARAELLRAGVSALAADRAIAIVANGAAPGGQAMRGAMLVDADSGERLESDPARGVRVSRMDMSATAADLLGQLLKGSGRDTVHLREALVLAGKVLLAPGIVAELCWSDDPDYTAGYVTSKARGYVRFPHLKERGSSLGGRAFFVRPGTDRAALSAFLQRQPILFEAIGCLHPDEAYCP